MVGGGRGNRQVIDFRGDIYFSSWGTGKMASEMGSFC